MFITHPFPPADAEPTRADVRAAAALFAPAGGGTGDREWLELEGRWHLRIHQSDAILDRALSDRP